MPAAPGYGYLLLDTVGAGSVLSSYLVMVRTADFNKGNLDVDEKVVFKLGRGPSCHLLLNQNTISRIQCSLIWWPVKNKWSILDGDIDAPRVIR